ncbi:RDD family protein [Acinetobacter baumannii 25493_8]|nr:RDD family protein [Acinetobacter baumannii 1202252]EXC48067.1 RDD family protein [Acinetobacter baumannii 1032241]EXC61692.1 RDD family protein [Acinetobacter baumannii 1040094]EXD42090.1 RDD family protein [Acinetobacter baumannii 562700]EXD96470.1 RDD family protein [Acinetobacter baumannii 942194]EXQ86276.1 RDD family protein [Acinetobacter baumannii 1058283]EYD35124.1 RDD family protein [Acinetobacter baumannii 25493_6]EYD36971.1 RDD family protein [Acinetobacter baumannii 25493_8]E
MQIYLARNNQQAGPYTLEQLNQMLASQQVLLTDLAWHEGMTEWKALGELTQGKLVYQPTGYSAFSANTNTPYNETIQHIRVETKTHELASISSRALAKIIDLLLWLPIAAIPSFFFNEAQYKQLFELQKQMQSAEVASTKAAELQQQLFTLIPIEAWHTMLLYVVIMLAIQAFLLTKFGQSIGKKIVGIRIVDAETNGKVNLTRIFLLRSVVFIILNLCTRQISQNPYPIRVLPS